MLNIVISFLHLVINLLLQKISSSKATAGPPLLTLPILLKPESPIQQKYSCGTWVTSPVSIKWIFCSTLDFCTSISTVCLHIHFPVSFSRSMQPIHWSTEDRRNNLQFGVSSSPLEFPEWDERDKDTPCTIWFNRPTAATVASSVGPCSIDECDDSDIQDNWRAEWDTLTTFEPQILFLFFSFCHSSHSILSPSVFLPQGPTYLANMFSYWYLHLLSQSSPLIFCNNICSIIPNCVQCWWN